MFRCFSKASARKLILQKQEWNAYIIVVKIEPERLSLLEQVLEYLYKVFFMNRSHC